MTCPVVLVLALNRQAWSASQHMVGGLLSPAFGSHFAEEGTWAAYVLWSCDFGSRLAGQRVLVHAGLEAAAHQQHSCQADQ